MTRLMHTTAMLIILSMPALAADLPSRRLSPAYVPPAAPAFSWTGLYAGGQVGFGFGEDHYTVSLPPILGGTTTSALARANGIVGGGHVGYNFAGLPGFGLGSGGLILGVEGDLDGSDYREPAGGTGVLRNDIMGSVRGRLGLAVDRALFYTTGGAAFALFHNDVPASGVILGQSFSHTLVGWTVGAGVEYALTTQWSLRAEYRYSQYGAFTDNVVVGPAVVPVRFRNDVQRAQVGFSYRFDTPAAVVARY